MSDNAIIILSLCLVIFFMLLGLGVPVLVFWYNREDARIFDNMRARFVAELARLQLDIDELIKDLENVRSLLYEERRQNAIMKRDLELQIKVNIQLGDQVAELERKLATVQELKRENAALKAENEQLHRTQRELETRVAHLEAELEKTNGDRPGK